MAVVIASLGAYLDMYMRGHHMFMMCVDSSGSEEGEEGEGEDDDWCPEEGSRSSSMSLDEHIYDGSIIRHLSDDNDDNDGGDPRVSMREQLLR